MVIGYAVGPIIISRRLAHLPSLGVVTASLLISAAAYAPFTPPSGRTAGRAGRRLSGRACRHLHRPGVHGHVRSCCRSRTCPMTVITYVSPAVAILLGAIVLDEPLTIGLAIGFPW